MTTLEIMGAKAKEASRFLMTAGSKKDDALAAIAAALREHSAEIIEANSIDIKNGEEAGLTPSLLDRLRLDEARIEGMAVGVEQVAALPDPVGRILDGRTLKNGLRIQKVSVPMGVIGIIYEARPNVTTDAAAVALKSGNAVILKGGSESIRSNRVLVAAMRKAIVAAGLPEDTVQLIDSTDHAAVNELLKQDRYIDVVIPRGGKGLIKAVSENTRIPVLKHYDGICHQYVAADADIDMAVAVVVNSKTERVEVCNALETLLVDRKIAAAFLPKVRDAFAAKGVEIRGCEKTRAILPEVIAATDDDWDTEYLAPIISIRVVDGLDEAVAHIAAHGSGHTDGIITNNLRESREFVARVDSASVLVNASTRLSGGGDYGMGAVVGISTDKLHARGPVGPNELCSYKWVAIGNGHLR